MTTQDTTDPVVVEGVAEMVTDGMVLSRTIQLINRRYSTDYPVEFLDPAVNATVLFRPRWAFGLVQRGLRRLADPLALRALTEELDSSTRK